MAAYKYSGLTIASNAATLDSFSTLDTFTFDDAAAGFSASEISSLVETSGNVVLTINNVAITFTGLGIDQIDATKFIFADGSRLLIGDGLAGTVNDTLSSVLLSTDGDDYIDGLTNTAGIGDTVSYANASALVNVDLALATAQDTSGAGRDLLINIENITGSNFNDNLKGNAGNNILTGGRGNDTMDGREGSDTYYVTAGDIITDTGTGTSTDVVIAHNTDFTLANTSGIETLILTGTSIMGVGNSSANRIEGNGLGNILDGAGGEDDLVGLGGNDTYLIDDTNDDVIETATGGIDLVVSIAAS